MAYSQNLRITTKLHASSIYIYIYTSTYPLLCHDFRLPGMLKTSTKQVVSTTFSCHDIKILTWRQQVKRITHVDNKWNANFGPANCKMLWRWLLFYFSFFTSKESLLKQSKGTWNSNPQFLIQKCLIHWVSQWVSPHERSKPPSPPCRIFNPLRQLASNPCAFRPPPSHWLWIDRDQGSGSGNPSIPAVL